MAYRRLEVTIISARDIKDVNLFTEMDVYVLASIGGDPSTQKKTPVHYCGGKNPCWDFTTSFSLDESLAKHNRLVLILQLKSKKRIGADRHVGVVHVPVKDLLDNPGTKFVSYQVRIKNAAHVPESSPAYRMGEPVMAYPAVVCSSVPYPPSGSGVPYQAQGGPYPPPSVGYPTAGYGNGQPQPPIGHPPQQLGYGYPPQQQPGYGYPPQGGHGGHPQQPPMVMK
ncbi:hypothetical protein C5167_037280 [Papaver somniferum]|uniref:C2 domain-containing protein n=1 Tax=Papaver somniferum TaxID=3469 RepID=A0A4Y7I5X0_PAPSO|nr:hypothetical protein C5167_037280 [Papaver somniferum]